MTKNIDEPNDVFHAMNRVTEVYNEICVGDVHTKRGMACFTNPSNVVSIDVIRGQNSRLYHRRSTETRIALESFSYANQ